MTSIARRIRGSSRAASTAALAAVLVLAVPIAGQDRDGADLDAIYRIKEEGLQRSKVMDIAGYLTDVHGPRLTGTPSIRSAGEWAVKEMQSWGLSNVALETWGEFGRGWTNDYFAAHMVGPTAASLIGHPKTWTPGTGGAVRAEAVLAVIESERDFDALRGRLKGKFALTAPARSIGAHFNPEARRFSDADLDARARQPVNPPAGRGGRGGASGPNIAERRMPFFQAEGVAATIEPGRGDGGTVFVQGGGSRDPKSPPALPQIVLAVEHYNRLVRILEREIPVMLELDVRNTFHDADLSAFNVVGEIVGSDRADELVMIGAHFDSWHAGTGATDNAAGAAVMMEAMRILRATGLPLRRTVRIALWTGEEHGLLGSRAYVTQHFADRETQTKKPGHPRLSVYFNHDNGTGAIRGIYLQGNEAIAPVFRSWMEPFRNLGMTTLAIRGTGGTDHQSFDAVGLPGFQFIQDPIEYDSRTHHSSMDVYDRLQATDLMQNAVIVASFAYHAANRDELLPRKPQPAPAAPRSAAPESTRP
jgi:hypothetical protein